MNDTIDMKELESSDEPVRIGGPGNDLKALLGEYFVEQAEIEASNHGYLSEFRWHPLGRRIGSTIFECPVLTANFILGSGGSKHLLKEDCAALVRDLSGCLRGLLPEAAKSSVSVTPFTPVYDRWNGCWTTEVLIAEGEVTLPCASEMAIDQGFEKPQGASSLEESAWKSIVEVLSKGGDLNSGGSLPVFYTPEQWSVTHDAVNEDAVLVIAHDGGAHAPYFDHGYHASALCAKMGTALRESGLYAQQAAPWYTVIRRLEDGARDGIPALTEWLESRPRMEGQMGSGDFDDIGDMKDMQGDPPTSYSDVEKALKKAGITWVNTFTVAYKDVVEFACTMRSGYVSNRDILEVLRSLGCQQEALDQVTFQQVGNDSVSVFVPKGAFGYPIVNEDEEDLDMKEMDDVPSDKADRIQKMFHRHGLHISQVIESPEDTDWGDMGFAMRTVTTYIQPDNSRPFTVSPQPLPELADFCRQLKAQLMPVLETGEIEWTTRWDDSIGAWQVVWMIGDSDIKEFRRVQEAEDADFDIDMKELEGGVGAFDREAFQVVLLEFGATDVQVRSESGAIKFKCHLEGKDADSAFELAEQMMGTFGMGKQHIRTLAFDPQRQNLYVMFDKEMLGESEDDDLGDMKDFEGEPPSMDPKLKRNDIEAGLKRLGATGVWVSPWTKRAKCFQCSWTGWTLVDFQGIKKLFWRMGLNARQVARIQILAGGPDQISIVIPNRFLIRNAQGLVESLDASLVKNIAEAGIATFSVQMSVLEGFADIVGTWKQGETLSALAEALAVNEKSLKYDPETGCFSLLAGCQVVVQEQQIGNKAVNLFEDDGDFLNGMERKELEVNTIQGLSEPEADDVVTERVAAAAVQDRKGRTWTGAYHGEAQEKASADPDCASGHLVSGFLTNTGRFVDREEAFQIAKAQHQLNLNRPGQTQLDAAHLKEEVIADYVVRNLLESMADDIAVEAEKAEEPKSPEQAEAGTYKKGHIRLNGMEIAIENAKGSTRSGEDKDGKKWSVTLPAHYGYVKGVKSKDEDHLDVYIGEHPSSLMVFVVNQNKIGGGFDEHKVMMGFKTKDEAIATYDAAFTGDLGPKLRDSVISVTVDQFKAWLEDGDGKKPFKPLEESSVEGVLAALLESDDDIGDMKDLEREPFDTDDQDYSSIDDTGLSLTSYLQRIGWQQDENGWWEKRGPKHIQIVIIDGKGRCEYRRYNVIRYDGQGDATGVLDQSQYGTADEIKRVCKEWVQKGQPGGPQAVKESVDDDIGDMKDMEGEPVDMCPKCQARLDEPNSVVRTYIPKDEDARAVVCFGHYDMVEGYFEPDGSPDGDVSRCDLSDDSDVCGACSWNLSDKVTSVWAGEPGAVEEGIKAWHASPNTFKKFDTTGEGAHFGTQEQASNLRKPGLKKAKPYDLDLKNPLRVSDIGTWTIDGIATELHRMDVINDQEADQIYAGRNQSDAQGYEVIKQILLAKGYDGFVYANELEGPGDSYVAFHAGQVKPLKEAVDISAMIAYTISIQPQIDQAKQAAADKELNEDEKASIMKGHGKYVGTCGHTIKQCRCSRGCCRADVDAPCYECAQTKRYYYLEPSDDGVKPVHEMQHFEQEREYDCGPTCIKMVANAMGKAGGQSIGEITELCGSDEVTGTDDRKMIIGMQAVGVPFIVGESKDTAGLEEALVRGSFIILRTLTRGIKHWVVVYGFQEGKFLVSDPWLGRLSYSPEEIIDIWSKRDYYYFEIPAYEK